MVPSAFHRSSIASVGRPALDWSSPVDASCGSASSVMKSWKGLASRSSTPLLQVKSDGYDMVAVFAPRHSGIHSHVHVVLS